MRCQALKTFELYDTPPDIAARAQEAALRMAQNTVHPIFDTGMPTPFGRIH
jgi:hypothetical protein